MNDHPLPHSQPAVPADGDGDGDGDGDDATRVCAAQQGGDKRGHTGGKGGLLTGNGGSLEAWKLGRTGKHGKGSLLIGAQRPPDQLGNPAAGRVE